MGQMALLIKKTSQQHFQNRLQTDSKGQTCSHTTQKQHSLQMCTNKTRSLVPQPPNITVLWLSSEVPPIPPPCSTAAQCFVKPSWADHALPCPRSGPGTHGPSLLTFKASLLGALTWRVMEEVDYTLLGCVEEGSGHGVVLSISTEKLKRQDKKELEVAGKVGYVPARSSSGQGRHLQHPWVSSPVSETQQGLCSC